MSSLNEIINLINHLDDNLIAMEKNELLEAFNSNEILHIESLVKNFNFTKLDEAMNLINKDSSFDLNQFSNTATGDNRNLFAANNTNNISNENELHSLEIDEDEVLNYANEFNNIKF